MSLSRKRFNLFIFLGTLAGYLWLLLIWDIRPEDAGSRYEFCMIRHFLHVPCPSCGTSRSVLSLFHGDIAGGFYWNPLGFLVLVMLVVLPLWVLWDMVLGTDTCHRFYLESERILKKRVVAIPLIILVLLNWIWNIYKGV